MRNLKSMTVAALAVLCACATCAGNTLLNYVPQNVNVLLDIKPKVFEQMPLTRELRAENPDMEASYQELVQNLRKYNLEIKDLPDEVVVFSDKDGMDPGLVAKMVMDEARFVKLLQSPEAKANKVEYKKETLGGKQVYVFHVDEKNLPADQKSVSQPTVLSFLAKDIVMVCQYDDFVNIVGQLKNASVLKNSALMQRKDQINDSAPLWAVFSLPEKKAQSAEVQQAMNQDPSENIRGGSFAVSFSGKDQRDICLELSVESKDENNAAMLKMQAQGMIMMMSGALFKDNPQLGAELGNRIKIEQNKAMLKASAKIDDAMQKKLKDYTKQQAQKAVLSTTEQQAQKTVPGTVQDTNAAAPLKK